VFELLIFKTFKTLRWRLFCSVFKDQFHSPSFTIRQLNNYITNRIQSQHLFKVIISKEH
jgi:hypothetical protein